MKKYRHVYYNKYTGEILEIVKDKKKTSNPFIKCEIDEVMPLLEGHQGTNEYIIAFDKDKKKHALFEKDNIIKLRNLGNKLYKIPQKDQSDYDLKITAYPSSNILEITLDASRLSRLCSTNLQDSVKFEEGTEIRLYLKDKSTKETLKTIVVNAQSLLDQVQVFYNVGDIDLNKVYFYTERLFETYIWSKGTAKFFSPIKDKVQFDIHKADSIERRDDFVYHLIITEVEDGLQIENFIEDLKLVKIFDPIEFYLVDKYDNNVLYDKFCLSAEDLQKDLFLVGLKKKFCNKILLYNHKYISVLFKESNND